MSSTLAPVSFTNLGDPQQGTTGVSLTFSDRNDNGERGFYGIIMWMPPGCRENDGREHVVRLPGPLQVVRN